MSKSASERCVDKLTGTSGNGGTAMTPVKQVELCQTESLCQTCPGAPLSHVMISCTATLAQP